MFETENLFMFNPEYEEDSPFGENQEEDLNVLLEAAENYLGKYYDKKLISDAFYYCVEKHEGMVRKSGKPFYTHPLNVSLVLLNEFPIYDSETVAACLLHDTIEDVEDVSKSEISEKFGIEVAQMVDGVTKISHEATSKLENKAATYRKIFLSLVKDVRVILIKLADRLHNIRTLHYLKESKQKDISSETLSFYTMLAHRLGLNKIKIELENLSFYYLDRDAYEKIKSELVEKRKEFITYIKSFLKVISESLQKQGIINTITIQHKHEYEIYIMMQEGKSLDDIDDFYSINIIIHSDDVSDCYRAHGILANTFDSIKFIDYISKPKFDWYKSLNTELIGPDGKKVEVLIRTEEMEKIAEEGFAAKFSLSGKRKALNITDEDIENWGIWMQEMIEEYPQNAIQIIWNSIKVNLFDAELTVYSKSGKPATLPDGSTILDYAFNDPKELGFSIISAKVNGIIKGLDYELKSGDQIEVITSPNVQPDPKWQQFVVTQKAIVKLYNYFKEHPLVDYPRPEEEKAETEKESSIKLKVIGEDKQGMLQKITEAIGKSNMKEIHLGSSGNLFEGAITIKKTATDDINKIFLKILNIPGIKGVNLIEDED